MKNLAISLRPNSLSEITGYEKEKTAIIKQLDSGRIPSAWLLIGEPGTGKTTFSLILAKLIQGKDFLNEPEIEEINGGTEGKVGEIRSLLSRIRYQYPLTGTYRAIIINEAHRLTSEAQEALLVPIEDTDSPNVWFLTTSDVSGIDPALLSRCKTAVYNLKGLSAEKDIYDLVMKAMNAVGDNSLAFDPIYKTIVETGLTSPRDIVNSVEAYAAGLSPAEAVLSPESEPEYREIANLVIQGNWFKLKGLLKKLKPSDAKPLRSVISGYLRSFLLTNGENYGTLISETLKNLALYSAFEAGVDLSGLVAVIYNHCKKQSGK